MSDSNSRIINATRNTIVGYITFVMSILVNFVTRTFFIKFLSKEALGINGLFSNVISIFSILELGFGTAMMYSYYKPLKERNFAKLRGYEKFFSKIYRKISFIIFFISVIIAPFLKYIIKEANEIENLYFIYFLFVSEVVFSYLMYSKVAIINADQKEYIKNLLHIVFLILKVIIQITILSITKSFILFLISNSFFVVLENIVLSVIADRTYILNNSKVDEIDYNERVNVYKMVKGTAIYRLSNVLVDSTDNILISMLFGITIVGFLSNYQLITGGLASMCRVIFVSLAPSVGNLNVTDDKLKKVQMFNVINFISFFVYSIISICLFILINPFINLWVGQEYLLSQNVALALSLNFFVTGLNQVLWIYRTTMGLHRYNQFRPILTVIFNIVLSIILGKILGVAGVIYATSISKLTTTMIFDPIIIYKFGFNKNVKEYFVKNTIYILCFTLSIIGVWLIFRTVVINNLIKWILSGIVLFGSLALIYLLLFTKSNELKYIFGTAKNFYIRIIKKHR